MTAEVRAEERTTDVPRDSAPAIPDERNVWSRLSLRAKGVATLALPMTALFVALFSITWVERQSQIANEAVSGAYDSRAALLETQVHLAAARAAMARFLAHGDDRRLAAFESDRKATEASLERLRELTAADPAGAATFLRLRHSARKALAILAPLRHQSDLGQLENATKAIGEVTERAALLNQALDLRLFRAHNDREHARQRLFRIVIVCGILGPLGGLFIHLLIAGRLGRRVHMVEENARRLAHGLPLVPMPRGTDEIGSLAWQLEHAAYLLNGRERELRESEQRYRDLFDRAPVAYEETDANGMVRRFNQEVCNLLKTTPDRILGRHAWDFVAPDQKESIRLSLLERMAMGMEAAPFECDYLLEDGSQITVEVRENLIRNAEGAVLGVCRSLVDVTERNLSLVAARKVSQYAIELRNKNEQLGRALEAARSATEAKSRFLASVSHELRTPLNGIIGFSELMYDGKLGAVPDDHREILGDILISAKHLLQLINDILDLSKVEAGKMEFRREWCELEEIVQEVCDVVRPLAEKKAIAMTAFVQPRVTAVLDRARLKQVLYNFLSNAVKFTPDGGSVAVRVDRTGGDCFRLEVRDTGVGIPPEEMQLLFNEFQQLPNSRKAEQGTGLGLALTKHIVEAQGGTIAARSTPGEGSVFSAVLPLHSELTIAAG